MVGWIILGVIVLLITVFNLIRIGADISYEGGQLAVSAKAAGITIRLLPKEEKDGEKPKKEKKPKKKKKDKKKEAGEEENAGKKKGLPLGMNREELFELLKAVLSHFARFPRKFRIDRFKLHLLIAGADPYNTAIAFSYVNECLSILLPLARRGFKVKESDVRTDVDFTTDRFSGEFALGLSIRIGQIFGTIFGTAIAGAGVILKSRKRQKKEKQAEEKPAPQEAPAAVITDKAENDTNDKEKEPEERKEEHGQ